MVLVPSSENVLVKTTDKATHTRFESLKDFDLSLFPLTCKKEYLAHLSYMYDVDIVGLSEKATRELLNRAITLKKYIGSVHYLKEALNSFDVQTKVVEWFDYSGEPYHFKVDIELSSKGLDNDFYALCEQKIEAFKNERSYLDGLNIKLKTQLQENYAVASFCGESITIYPYIPKDIKIETKQRYGIGLKLSEVVQIKADFRLGEKW